MRGRWWGAFVAVVAWLVVVAGGVDYRCTL